VLADGRRGLALGVALATAALAAVVWPDAGPAAAAVLGLGGLAAAARRLVVGTAGWGIMPPGSTPRFILCIGGGLLASWIALGVGCSSRAAPDWPRLRRSPPCRPLIWLS